MIGTGASERAGAFNRIETIHRRGDALYAPFLGKVVGIAQSAGLTGEKIRIERQDHVGFIKMIERRDLLPKGQLRSGLHGMIGDWFILVPRGGGKAAEQCPELLGQRGRRHGFCEDAQPRTILEVLGLQGGAQGRNKGLPGTDLSTLQHRL